MAVKSAVDCLRVPFAVQTVDSKLFFDTKFVLAMISQKRCQSAVYKVFSFAIIKNKKHFLAR